MTAARPTSEPVPAVVGIAIVGRMRVPSACLQLSPISSYSRIWPGLCARSAMHFPTSIAEPPPIKTLPALPCPFLDPDTTKRPVVKLSYGFPLTLEIIVNPQAPVPTEAKLGELFTKHGLPLTSAELKALTDGRSEGVDQLETIIRDMAPSLGPGCARALAEKIADGLMGESLGGQLGREHPGTEERLAEQEERMRDLTGAPDRGLDIQGGVKLIIHF